MDLDDAFALNDHEELSDMIDEIELDDEFALDDYEELPRFTFPDIITRRFMTSYQWITLTTEEEKLKYLDELWNLYVNTYSHIGIHVTKDQLLEDNWAILDLNDDGKPEVAYSWKNTKYGYKITSFIHNGTRLAKRIVVEKMKELLNTDGWYAEISERPEDVLSGHVPFVTNDIAKIVLYNKEIKPLDDGYHYVRVIGDLGEKTKVLAGKPILDDGSGVRQ